MADFSVAFQNTLKFEDSEAHPGEITAEPHGGRARLGINSLAHPEVPDSFWTGPYDEAVNYAESLERVNYWNPLNLDSVQSQDIANKVFDLAINTGVKTTARMVQEAVGVMIDGAIGPVSLAAINSADPVQLLQKIKSLAVMHYESIVASDPAEYAQYLTDWKDRALS